MSETNPSKPFFGFSKPFWVVNGIELLERGAYYTFNAVFFVFMTQLFTANGMSAADAVGLAGLIIAGVFLLLYTVPVLSAPFAEKYGYRASLAVVFILLAAGYVTTLFATGVGMVVLAALLIGVGAGVFKPIPAAVVTQTSTEEKRGLAFSIYYACINIGALVFPLSAGLAAILFPDLLFQIAFLAAATLSGINLLLSVFLFRNLRAPDREKNVLETVARLGEIRHHPAFLVLMAIYAGFWFMYALAISVMSQYMGDFSRMPEWFNVSLLQSINPAVIIVLAPFLGLLASRAKPLTMMIVGISVYSLGLALVGFTNTSLFFVAGVVGYSIGELIAHPAYLGYVSRIVPPEKVSVFLGYGFIPIGVGQFVGALVGSQLYARIAIINGQPALYWALMAGMGVLTVAALVVYNHFVTPRAPAPEPAQRRGILGGATGAFAIAIVAVLLGGALVGAAALQPAVDADGDADGGAPLNSASLGTLELAPVTDEVEEGATNSHTLTLPDGTTGVATFTLTWTDEAAPTATGQNAPDEFVLRVTLPDGTLLESEPSTSGSLELAVPDAVPGEYVVEVELVEAGDMVAINNPLGLPLGSQPDTGNAYELAASHQAPAA